MIQSVRRGFVAIGVGIRQSALVVADAPWQAVWLRRVAPRDWLRRRLYEVGVVLSTGERRRHVTRVPVTAIDQHLGVGVPGLSFTPPTTSGTGKRASG